MQIIPRGDALLGVNKYLVGHACGQAGVGHKTRLRTDLVQSLVRGGRIAAKCLLQLRLQMLQISGLRIDQPQRRGESLL